MHHTKSAGCTHCPCVYGRHGIPLIAEAGSCTHLDDESQPCGFAEIYDGACYQHATSEQVQVRTPEYEREHAEQARRRTEQRRMRRIRSRKALIVLAAALPVLLSIGAWINHRSEQRQLHEALCRKARAQFAVAHRADGRVVIPLRLTQSADAIKTAYAQRRQLAGRSAAIVTSRPHCFNDSTVVNARTVQALPLSVAYVEMPHPTRCRDGWRSPSIGRRGACSHHGGVDYALLKPIVDCEPLSRPYGLTLSETVLASFGCS
ncbi:hypothetical protein [Actinomadura verrucosospora]